MSRKTTIATMNGHEMFPDVGNENRNMSTTIHSSAMIAIGRDHLPRLQTRSFFHSSVVMPSQIGTP